MKKFVTWLIGFVCGFGVCLGALGFFLLILMAGSYHYVMEYPHTEVWLDKNEKIRSIDFDVRENPRLPLYVRHADRILKLDAATTVDEVEKFLDGCGGEYSKTTRERKFFKGGMDEDSCEIFFSAIWLRSKDGKNLSQIEICNRPFPSDDHFAAVETASGKRFVFPLDRKNVEELLGRDYRFRKQQDK